jgi:hypothetical protein
MLGDSVTQALHGLSQSMVLQSDVPESGVERSQGLVSKVEGELQTRPGRQVG